MPRTLTSDSPLDRIISGIRENIIESILSRENASSIKEIVDDLDAHPNAPKLTRGNILHHLSILEKREILDKSRFGDNEHNSNDPARYYINPHNDKLQGYLCKKFPFAFTEAL